jgi:hypothetical protein
MGSCEGTGGDLMIDAFGIIAMVAMAPLIVIQLMGLVYQFKTREAEAMTELQTQVIGAADEIIDYGAITVFEEGNF